MTPALVRADLFSLGHRPEVPVSSRSRALARATLRALFFTTAFALATLPGRAALAETNKAGDKPGDKSGAPATQPAAEAPDLLNSPADTLAAIEAVCVADPAQTGDPVAYLTTHFWYALTMAHDRGARSARFFNLFRAADRLSGEPGETPNQTLEAIHPWEPTDVDADVRLQNSMTRDYLAVIDLTWAWEQGGVERICTVIAAPNPEFEAYFDALAERAGATRGATVERTDFVTTLGNLPLAENPPVTVWAWKLDAEAYAADAGAPPEATLFFEYTMTIGDQAGGTD